MEDKVPSSSTSSSKPEFQDAMERLPATAKLRTNILALVVALGLFTAWEVYVRVQDIPPQLREEAAYLAALRLMERPRAERRVILLGSSRVQFDLPPHVIEEELGEGWEVRNAGLGSTSGVLQLSRCKHLFRNGDVVVVETLPAAVVRDKPSVSLQVFEAGLETDWALMDLELLVHGAVRENLSSKRVAHHPLDEMRDRVRSVAGMAEPEGAASMELVYYANGWAEYEATGSGVIYRSEWDRESAGRIVVFPPEERTRRFERALERFHADVMELENGGITVCLLRAPSNGEYLRREQVNFPRAEIWDRLAAVVPGRAWHFEDDRFTRDMMTFDGSHLPGHTAAAYAQHVAKNIKTVVRRH